MSDQDQVFRLTGWIRLVPGDGFGISLFHFGNGLYIAETNNRLEITCFHAFYNEEGYTIDHGLPPGHRDRIYSVGEGGPIPFSEGGRLGIVDVGIGSEEILKTYGAQIDQGVVGTIARVVLQAENGSFERLSTQREIREFERRFGTVFTEAPVHSRYWVEQYEQAIVALADARTATYPESWDSNSLGWDSNSLAWQKLKMIGSEWLRRFSSSGAPNLLFTFLAVEERNRFRSSDEMKAIYHSVFVSLISKNDYRSLLRSTVIERVRDRVPEGLYYYELAHPEIVAAQMGGKAGRDTNPSVDLLELMAFMLEDGEKRIDFRLAFSLADLLFGKANLPPDVHGRAQRIAGRLVEIIERGRTSYRGYAPQDLKIRMLATYRALVTLRQILDWESQPVSGARGLGLSSDAVWLLQQFLAEEAASK